MLVEFDSIVMPEPQRVARDFIAQHDQVRKGDFAGYRLNSDTTPDGAPPLETRIRVKVPLKALDRVQLRVEGQGGVSPAFSSTYAVPSATSFR